MQEEGSVKLMVRSLIRPPGTPYRVRGRLFSRREKEKLVRQHINHTTFFEFLFSFR